MNTIEEVRERLCRHCETQKPLTTQHFRIVKGYFIHRCRACEYEIYRLKNPSRRMCHSQRQSGITASQRIALNTTADIAYLESEKIEILAAREARLAKEKARKEAIREEFLNWQAQVKLAKENEGKTREVDHRLTVQSLVQEQRETVQELARWEESAARARERREAEQEAEEQAYEAKIQARKAYKSNLLEGKWDEWAEQSRKARNVPQAANACLCCHSRHAGEGCYCARCKEMGKGEKR